MDPTSIKTRLQQTARRDFPSYYLMGTPQERASMDMLVILTWLLVTMSDARREENPASEHGEDTLERIRIAVSELIEQVRGTRTFAELPVFEQMKIESAIFGRSPGVRAS